MLPPLRGALAARCTVGEICEVLREEWGDYDRARAPVSREGPARRAPVRRGRCPG
jgi:hypothetical protein